MAKLIIRLYHGCFGRLNHDAEVESLLKVVLIPNCGVLVGRGDHPGGGSSPSRSQPREVQGCVG